MFSVFCKYLLKDASYRKRPIFMKYASFNYASSGTIPETIGATGEAVEQFEVTSLFERRNNILRFVCKYLLKYASNRKRTLFMKYASFNYASIGIIREKIGATGESVEQFEVTSFYERKIIFSGFCKYLLEDASYRKRIPFMKYTSFNYASIGTVTEKIGSTGEAVEQFEVMSLFERRNKILDFEQLSPKLRILQKKDPLYEICII